MSVVDWEAATCRRSEGWGLRVSRRVRGVSRASLGAAAAVVSMAFERKGFVDVCSVGKPDFFFSHGLCLRPFVDG